LNGLIKLLATVVALTSFPGIALAQTSQQANVIENIVALQVAQTECGYKVNYDMLGITMSAVNLRTTDLVPGGKYWASVERNQSRVRRLTATSAGKSSFCRNIRRDLSAMFD
jgi:hypothetical protein